MFFHVFLVVQEEQQRTVRWQLKPLGSRKGRAVDGADERQRILAALLLHTRW